LIARLRGDLHEAAEGANAQATAASLPGGC